MWSIHGKKYDLTKFLDTHPGGRLILESCKGDTDCTATFESYHSMCNIEKIRSMMQKYEVGESDIKPMHTFNDQGFYKTVQRRVKKYFHGGDAKISHRANATWVLKAIIVTCLYLMACYGAFYSDDVFVIRLIFSVCAGILMIQAGFIVLHDASHCALFKNSKVNELLSQITNGIILWDHRMWAIHHSYRHHSFTSDPVLDPDTIHLRPFVKKHKEDKESKYIRFFRHYPKLTTIMSMFFLPGSCTGQCIVYHLVWKIRGYLWGMKLPDTYKISALEIGIKLFMLFSFWYSGSFLIPATYLVFCNISYFLAIIPDHDMFQTVENKMLSSSEVPVDWGELQVRNSGNFATDNVLLTELYGGINYQIEHHLFPAIAHIHYKAISHIVKRTCDEFSIPYVETKGLTHAITDVLKNFASQKLIDSDEDKVQ